MSDLLSQLLDEKGVLLADGATGSNLFQVGLQTGDSPELWNADQPEKIAQHYRGFIEAGSDIILTNTFGGTSYRLKLHDAADRVEELNVKAAQIACDEVAKSGRKVIVAGSMGPTGEIYQPMGTLTIDDAADAYEEQARALKKGGVDVLWVETISSREEIQAAIMGGARVGLPIVTTYSIETNGRTMMGLSPSDIIEFTNTLNPQPLAIGSNCGVGASELVATIINLKTAAQNAGVEPIIVAKANCGIPQYVDGEIVYSGTEEIMQEYIRMAVDAGARIIGGCCGTSYNHVAAMRAALDAHQKQTQPNLSDIEERLGEVSSGAKAQLRGELSIEAGAVGGANSADRRASRRRRSE